MYRPKGSTTGSERVASLLEACFLCFGLLNRLRMTLLLEGVATRAAGKGGGGFKITEI